ncbi:M23 family metallopeptidase [Paenibacillus aurantius]|uniref:M23 family metallopeptidase n=1 Tax=Paenibacillus aurantius TaxID=2918900 RepID=A0AA96LKB0_9BACL|nr:M23 family metallopeptidase [Paenibacillus aurantius]WNQ12977.1 M23 family metallopeptidase [Paenibacillus aurantius]
MERISSVRQRRQDRIREIQERTSRGGRPEATEERAPSNARVASGFPTGYRDNPPLPVSPPDKRFEDPEYVWKLKERQLLGLPPTLPEWETDRPGRPVRPIGWRLTVSAVLFAAVWGLFQVQAPWAADVQAVVRQSLTREWDFTRAAVWYEERFGAVPSFLPAFHPGEEGETKAASKSLQAFHVPARGTIVSAFANSHPWVVLQTEPGTVIHAMDTGRILSAGLKESSGYTLVIQHANGLQTTYGLLDKGAWAAGDWVKGGEALGKASLNSQTGRGSFYFAVMKDKEYLNPADVVRFD